VHDFPEDNKRKTGRCIQISGICTQMRTPLSCRVYRMLADVLIGAKHLTKKVSFPDVSEKPDV
jgi:hypothetical protein